MSQPIKSSHKEISLSNSTFDLLKKILAQNQRKLTT